MQICVTTPREPCAHAPHRQLPLTAPLAAAQCARRWAAAQAAAEGYRGDAAAGAQRRKGDKLLTLNVQQIAATQEQVHLLSPFFLITLHVLVFSRLLLLCWVLVPLCCILSSGTWI